LIEESIGDCLVPNMTTEMLARAIGAKLMTPSITDVFGLDTVSGPTDQTTLVQYHMVDDTDIYFPPETNVPPTVDNGVHTNVCFLPNVVDQVVEFTRNEMIKQFCDGPCDPE
jgi:hypothetical protein